MNSRNQQQQRELVGASDPLVANKRNRRMSCALTIPAVRDRSKTVTRRHPATWRTLAVGDRLTLIEKGMGLPKGARQVVLAEVEIVSVALVILGHIDPVELAAEGFPGMAPADFVSMWLASHAPLDGSLVRRIEWRYLASASGSTANE